LEGIQFFWVFDRLDAEKKFCQVVDEASRERIVILASPVLEVAVPLVVEHLVGRQVHGGVQQL
jgi:hypothetical protein